MLNVNISAVLIGTRGSTALSTMLGRDLKPKEKMVMDLTAAVTDSTSPLAVSNSFHNRVYCVACTVLALIYTRETFNAC